MMCSSWVPLWWTSGLLIVQTGIAYSDTCTTSNPLKEVNGKSLQGFIIWALEVRDIVQCAQACVQQTICRSFNFNTKTNFCELNSKVKEEKPEFVVDKADIIYSAISKWDPEIFPECFNKPCPENAVCLAKTLAEPGCNFSCLEIPISCPGGGKYGQKKSHQCPKGQVGNGFSVCQADTTWSEIDFSGCKADCGQPIFNLMLEISDGGTLTQSTRQVKCAKGLRAAGVDNITIVCQQNGSWSGPQYIDCRGFRFASRTSASNATEGLLQMFFKNEWRYVHEDHWKSSWTRTACESLNLSYGGSWHASTSLIGPMWKMAGRCENPINCSQSKITGSNRWLNAVGITCFTEILNSSNVRLVNANSNNATEGYVELFFRGDWGTICVPVLPQWTDNDKTVLCEMMNMKRDGDARVAQKPTTAWTSGLNCKNNDKSIFECKNLGWQKKSSCSYAATAKCKV